MSSRLRDLKVGALIKVLHKGYRSLEVCFARVYLDIFSPIPSLSVFYLPTRDQLSLSHALLPWWSASSQFRNSGASQPGAETPFWSIDCDPADKPHKPSLPQVASAHGVYHSSGKLTRTVNALDLRVTTFDYLYKDWGLTEFFQVDFLGAFFCFLIRFNKMYVVCLILFHRQFSIVSFKISFLFFFQFVWILFSCFQIL